MGGTYAVTMGDRGRLVIPAEVRSGGLQPGDPLVLVDTGDGVVVLTREQARARVRAQLAGPSLVDELLAERREAAASDDRVDTGTA